MFLLVSLSKFFTRVALVSFVQCSCRTRVVRVALASHSRLTFVALVSLESHSSRIRVARVALVSLVSGTRVVNQTRCFLRYQRRKNNYLLKQQKQPPRILPKGRCSENVQENILDKEERGSKLKTCKDNLSMRDNLGSSSTIQDWYQVQPEHFPAVQQKG